MATCEEAASETIPLNRELTSEYHGIQRQAFINYNFSCTSLSARKTVLSARTCAWEIVQVKKKTCTLLIIT